MKQHLFATISAVLALSTVCQADDFEKFRLKVQDAVPKEWKCEEVQDSEGKKWFELGSKQSRFQIYFSQTAAISQVEWEERSARFKAAVDRAANSPHDKNAIADAMTVLRDASQLPDARFGATAVQIRVTEPELSYPDSERDGKEVREIVIAIQALVQPYKKR